MEQIVTGRSVLDKRVGPAEIDDMGVCGVIGEGFLDSGAEAARSHGVLPREKELDAFVRLFPKERGIDGLCEAGVDMDGTNAVAEQNAGKGIRVGVFRTESPDCDRMSVCGLSAGDFGGASELDGRIDRKFFWRATARVSDREGAGIVRNCEIEHCAQVCRRTRLSDGKRRDWPKEGDIEDAVVGCAVAGDDSCAIERKNDAEVLKGGIVDDAIDGALKECGIDGHNRAESAGGEAGGENHLMFLADSDIVKLLSIVLCEFRKTGSGGHSGRNGEKSRVGLGSEAEMVAEYLRPGNGIRLGWFSMSGFDIEGRRGMPGFRMGFGGRVALSFFCRDMDQNG